MSKKLKISSKELARLLAIYKSNRKIARVLGCSEMSIRRYIHDYRLKKNKNSIGRPTIISKRGKNKIYREYKSCNLFTAQEGANLIREYSHKIISPKTISRTLKSEGIKCLVRKKKPEIKDDQRKKRKIFYETYKDFTYHKFSNFIFSDESTFYIKDNSRQRTYYTSNSKIQNKKSIRGTNKFGGGSIMVWGYITIDGVGKLYRVDESMDSTQYIKILEKSLLDDFLSKGLDIGNYIFVQDNATCHSSKMTKKWLSEQNIKTIVWPPNSPDLNIIENVWSILKRAVSKRQTEIFDKDSLFRIVEEEFNKISLDYIRGLYKSLPRRLKTLKEFNFFSTNY